MTNDYPATASYLNAKRMIEVLFQVEDILSLQLSVSYWLQFIGSLSLSAQ